MLPSLAVSANDKRGKDRSGHVLWRGLSVASQADWAQAVSPRAPGAGAGGRRQGNWLSHATITGCGGDGVLEGALASAVEKGQPGL